MPDRKLLVAQDEKQKRQSPLVAGSVAWVWTGWFGGLLTAIVLLQFFFHLLPPNLGSEEWTFGAVSSAFSDLPMLSVGLGALLASALVTGTRWLVMGVAGLLIVVSVLILSSYGLFLMSVPRVLSNTPADFGLPVKKLILSTTLLGLSMAGAYVLAAIAAVRQLRKRSH